jgi:hypothetical protein
MPGNNNKKASHARIRKTNSLEINASASHSASEDFCISTSQIVSMECYLCQAVGPWGMEVNQGDSKESPRHLVLETQTYQD